MLGHKMSSALEPNVHGSFVPMVRRKAEHLNRSSLVLSSICSLRRVVNKQNARAACEPTLAWSF
jgi:hypothetical protein